MAVVAQIQGGERWQMGDGSWDVCLCERIDAYFAKVWGWGVGGGVCKLNQLGFGMLVGEDCGEGMSVCVSGWKFVLLILTSYIHSFGIRSVWYKIASFGMMLFKSLYYEIA